MTTARLLNNNMGLQRTKCEHCNKNLAFFTSEKDDKWTFKCRYCGKETITERPRPARDVLAEIIKQHSGRTLEEYEADNGIF